MSAPRTATVIADAPEGVIRVYVPGADDSEGRKIARTAAAGVAHGLVGGVLRSVKANRGYVRDYAPVTRRAAAPAAPAPTTGDDRLAFLERELARVTALLADQGTPAPAAKREVPPVIAARIAASHAITCKTCRDLGVVRGVGKNAGQPYRTADGAAAAKAAGRAVKCPSHTKARKSA